MNQLPLSKRAQIINLLVEGNSIHATSRITGASKNTITKLLVELGNVCASFNNDTVVGVKSKSMQCDEIKSFIGAKEKNTTEEMKGNGLGDAWTWTAVNADSKLILSYFARGRDADSASIFMNDVASRFANRVQLTTDGHKAYLDALEDAFVGQVDYAQLVKIYGGATGSTTNERNILQ